MSNESPEPETVLRKAFRAMMRGVGTAQPGMVVSYDASKCEADVQPLIMMQRPNADGSVTAVPRPIVPHVPVAFVGGGGSRLTFPVKAGDGCLLITSSAALDRWLALGGSEPVDPQDDRQHHIGDGIAIVGLESTADVAPANADATVLEGADIRLGDQSATAGVARQNDMVGLTSILGIVVLQSLLDTRYQLRASPPPLALVDTNIGYISSASSTVKAV